MLGLRLQQVHRVVRSEALLLSNHISWLDIPVLGAVRPLRFLSKSEVRRWPLIGWMSEKIGTLFIERGGNQSARINAQIGEAIQSGHAVVVFPEGTTSNGHQLRRFHPRLLGAAQQPGMQIQPVAIRYGSNQDPDPVAPFINDDGFLAHLWRVLKQPAIQVQVRFLPALRSEGMDRRSLAVSSQDAIAEALSVPVTTRSSLRVNAEETSI
jgi:1-acyl-sn-glycerol-3-phosphate acyltransferase